MMAKRQLKRITFLMRIEQLSATCCFCLAFSTPLILPPIETPGCQDGLKAWHLTVGSFISAIFHLANGN